MYAAVPKGRPRVAIPVTGKVTRGKIDADRKARMDLMAYQTGTFDTIESRLAYLEQQGQFWGVEQEMAKELVQKQAFSKRAHGKPIVPAERDANFVTGAFTTDDVAADAQGSVFGALAPSSVVAAAANRAQRRLRKRGCRGCGPGGLGVAPLAVAAAISPFIKSSATKGRLQENQDNYTAVMNGTASADNCCPTPQSALDQLTNRAGLGPAGVAGTGDGATKDDARAKLSDLLATGTIFGPPLPAGFQRVRYTISPAMVAGAGALKLPSGPPTPPAIRPLGPPAFVDGGGLLPTPPAPAGPSIADQVSAAFAKIMGGGSAPVAPAPGTSITITQPSAPPAPRVPRTKQAGLFSGGGSTLVTLAAVGLGALVLSKFVRR